MSAVTGAGSRVAARGACDVGRNRGSRFREFCVGVTPPGIGRHVLALARRMDQSAGATGFCVDPLHSTGGNAADDVSSGLPMVRDSARLLDCLHRFGGVATGLRTLAAESG